MPLTDRTLAELRACEPELEEPPGLDEFWARTLAEAEAYDLAVTATPVETGLVTVETHDVTFAGFAGHPIRAWLHLPAAAVRGDRALTGIVQFLGYNGGRGLPHEQTFWAQAGYAHLVVDTRGQGSGWAKGDTGDPAPSGPAQPGFLTRGIESPETHFYRRVYVDACRAIAVLRGRPEVGAVVAAGGSQGGGISLATAGLVPDLAAVMPDVPFLCHFRRAAEIADRGPYDEIARYLAAHRDRVEQTFATLAHVDAALLGKRASAPALFSVAMMDQTCPPSTVFAAYHLYGGPKEIEVYEFNDHEGGMSFQQRRQLAWLAEVVG